MTADARGAPGPAAGVLPGGEPVDLLGSNVAIPVLKRLIPALIGAFLALKIVKKIFRRGGKA